MLSPMSTQGKYRIVRPLATGGMSELFLARQVLDEGRQRAVVVKQLLPRLVEVPEQLAMFVNEGRILASLDHPNIVKVYELGIASDNYFLVMEYLRGVPLEALIKEASRKGEEMPYEMAAHIIGLACTALDHVHNHKDELGQPLGLVHRDLNAGNLMITFRGEVKLVDFGLAKITSSPDATKGGELKGTYAYMSPEQCRGDDLDSRSDLFSLGVMLYELCCRRRLFRRNNEFATIRAILEDPIPSPGEVNEEVPEAMQAIITRALARDREERYQSASEMGEELAEAAASNGWESGRKELADFMDDTLAEAWEASGNTPYGEVLPEIETESSEGMVLELEALPPEVKIEVADDGEHVSMDFAPITDEELAEMKGHSESAASPSAVEDKPLVSALKVDRPAELQAPPPAKRRVPVIIAACLVPLIAAVAALLVMGKTDLFSAKVAEVALSSTPAGAMVYLNGKRYHGVTPLTLKDVPVGHKNSLVLVLAGHEPWQHSFTVGRGAQIAPISATLKQTEKVQGKSVVLVSTEPAGARVFLDGELKGKSDIEIAGVDCSTSHTIVIKLEGYEDHTESIEKLKPGEPHFLEVKLTEAAVEPEPTPGKEDSPGGGAASGENEPMEIQRATPLPALGGRSVGETVPGAP